jgi:hypothetical protein
MTTLVLTGHAAMRMAQRSIKLKDAELIALIGTEVADGYLVRDKDYQGRHGWSHRDGVSRFQNAPAPTAAKHARI